MLPPTPEGSADARASPAARPADPRATRTLAALCVTVTISYGVLYYAFTVLAPAITADTGWSTPAITTAFSVGNLLGAIAGVAVGRVIQARGPRVVMTTGSVLGAAAIGIIAIAPTMAVFVVGWLLAGAANAGTFYPPAFAALTQWFGAHRVRAITTLTLVAGFASTIFAPLTALLSEELGWRGAYLVLGSAMVVINAPAHFFALRLPWRPHEQGTRHRPDKHVLTSRPFVLVTASGTLAALTMYSSIVHLVALLLDQGFSVQLAAWVLGLSGAGQVAGRLLYPWLDRRFAPHARATLIISLLAATLIALSVTPGPSTVVIAIAVLSGAARGLFTLIAATVVGDYWGTERYAALNGIYNAPVGIATAVAPAFGAAIAATTGSYRALFAVLGVLAFISATLAARAGTPPTHSQAHR